ncbi:MAG: hypothetical protein K2L07_10685 [Lachnospiraceae bacterium]|nr:hypothetical protein [Lachnospiraceae bacterium]
MSGNIKTIKFTAKLSVIFALFTYIVDRNIELGFFVPNWSWMSNNFALAVCGGVFASTLVVMFCEVQKYWSNKVDCEQYLFYQTMYLYIALFLMQRNVGEYIETKTEPVPESLLESPVQKIQCQVNAIQSVDYTTFSAKSKLMIARRDFSEENLAKINVVLQYHNYLKSAILQTRIKNLEQFGKEKIVTSSDKLVFKTLTIIDKQCKPLLDEISNYLEIIDQSCGGRFDWKTQQEKIHEGYISIFKVGKFEDFLQEESK